MLYCFRAFLSLSLCFELMKSYFFQLFIYNTLVATRVKNRREKISNYIIFRFESQPSPFWIEFFETGLILSRYRFAIYSRDIGTRSKFRVGRNARPFPITPANLEIVISRRRTARYRSISRIDRREFRCAGAQRSRIGGRRSTCPTENAKVCQVCGSRPRASIDLLTRDHHRPGK